MENFAQAMIAGVVVSATIPPMYYFNKAVLASLFAVNKEIGKVLMRVIQPNETRYVALKHTCDKADCQIVSCYCDRDHHSCYNCDVEKLELNP